MRNRLLVSGQAGVAVLVDVDGVRSYHRHGHTWVARSQAELPYLFGSCKDVVVFEDVPPGDVPARLEEEWTKQRALVLMLMLLDSETSEATKKLAVEGLRAVHTSGVERAVVHRLFAAPMPPEADLEGAIALASEMNAGAVVKMLVETAAHQSDIGLCRSAWDAVPVGAFGGTAQKEGAAFRLVLSGAFYKLAIASPKVKYAVFNDLLEDGALEPGRAGILAWRAQLGAHWPLQRAMSAS